MRPACPTAPTLSASLELPPRIVPRARSPGRHLVVRSTESLPKTVAVLLHAWGHTLGAVHATGADRIMNAEYHPDATFSQRDLELIGIGLAHFPIMLKDDAELAT